MLNFILFFIFITLTLEWYGVYLIPVSLGSKVTVNPVKLKSTVVIRNGYPKMNQGYIVLILRQFLGC